MTEDQKKAVRASYEALPKATWEGPRGRAWKRSAVTEEMLKEHPDWRGGLDQWLIYVPGAHPFWHSYIVATISLATLEGVKAAVKHYPGAEYEMMILALDPEHPLPDVTSMTSTYRPLLPPNLMKQWHGTTLEQAKEVTELMVRSFVDGYTSPDSDYRRMNELMIDNTVEHMVLGGHPKAEA